MKRSDSHGEKKTPLDLGLGELAGEHETEEAGEQLQHPATCDSQFALCAQKEDWQGLAELSEKSIVGLSPEKDAEAKLWWITSQFHLSHVPISILAAPLDLLCRDLEEGRLGGGDDAVKPRLTALAVDLLEAFIPKLKEAGDLRLADVFESRLAKFPGHQQDAPPYSSIADEATGKKESQQGKKGLSEAERLRMDLGITPETSAPLSVVDPALLNILAKEETSFWKSYFLVGLVVAGILVCGAWWYLHHLAQAALEAAAVPTAPAPVASKREMRLIAPEINRIEDVNSLSSLLYTIDEKKTPQVAAPQPAPQQQQQAQIPPRPELPRQKERIDTNYPPEPGSQADRGEQGRDPLWGDQKRRERSPFGDDDAERGIPVIKFPRPEVYRIITDTLVLPRPSLRGQPIQRLHKGDEVLVEAKVGYWLRLRSQSNRPGFILAQDAEVK